MINTPDAAQPSPMLKSEEPLWWQWRRKTLGGLELS
jgi:hypothetical protein